MNSEKKGVILLYNFKISSVEIIWCLQVIFFSFHCSNLHVCSNYCSFSLTKINLMGVSKSIYLTKRGSFKLSLCSRTWNPIISTFFLKLWFHVSILHVFLYHPSCFSAYGRPNIHWQVCFQTTAWKLTFWKCFCKASSVAGSWRHWMFFLFTKLRKWSFIDITNWRKSVDST